MTTNINYTEYWFSLPAARQRVQRKNLVKDFSQGHWMSKSSPSVDKTEKRGSKEWK
jgi:hypothetical protein